METIKVKYFSDDMEELCYVAGKSDWIDLSAAEEVTLHAGDFQLIPLGVAIALPEGYEAHLAPRSSTFKNFGILQTNSVGVVDYSYRGDGIGQRSVDRSFHRVGADHPVRNADETLGRETDQTPDRKSVV